MSALDEDMQMIDAVLAGVAGTHKTSGAPQPQQKKTGMSEGARVGTRKSGGTLQPQQAGTKALAHDARGRFKSHKSKAQLQLEKLKAQQAKLQAQVKALEAICAKEAANATAQHKRNEQKALKKMAQDFHWLAKMVWSLRTKLKDGTVSQKRWAKRNLPKYEQRKKEASQARQHLEAVMSDAELRDLRADDEVMSPLRTQQDTSLCAKVCRVDEAHREASAVSERWVERDQAAETGRSNLSHCQSNEPLSLGQAPPITHESLHEPQLTRRQRKNKKKREHAQV